MTVRVCTLMWGNAWERYGNDFCSSFNKFWPGHVELVVVTDRNLPMLRGRQIDLHSLTGYRTFLDRNGANPQARGYEINDAKVDADGYAWKFDACKWMPQGLAPAAAAQGLEHGDILIWLDADVETTSRVPADWAEQLIGAHDVAVLQRPPTHSEIGFIGMRMNARTDALLETFAGLYTSDGVFELDEWHSAFVFDRAAETVPGLRIRNLNPVGRGHVWPASPLAAHTVHKKGKRKDL